MRGTPACPPAPTRRCSRRPSRRGTEISGRRWSCGRLTVCSPRPASTRRSGCTGRCPTTSRRSRSSTSAAKRSRRRPRPTRRWATSTRRWRATSGSPHPGCRARRLPARGTSRVASPRTPGATMRRGGRSPAPARSSRRAATRRFPTPTWPSAPSPGSRRAPGSRGRAPRTWRASSRPRCGGVTAGPCAPSRPRPTSRSGSAATSTSPTRSSCWTASSPTSSAPRCASTRVS